MEIWERKDTNDETNNQETEHEDLISFQPLIIYE